MTRADDEPSRAVRALTPQQRAAIEVPGSVLVRAGAGSGKTVVLVERYVQAICGDRTGVPLELEQVIAVTFTEKAAAEMRTRIRDRLTERAAEASGEARLRLIRIQRALASARIGTIHALAAALLRRAPVESRIDPAGRILDEIEGPIYVEREVRRALLARLRGGDDDVRRCADAWGFGTPGADLVSIVCDVLAALARRGLTVADLAAAGVAQEAAAAAARAELQRDIATLITDIDRWLVGDARETAAKFRAGWAEWRSALGTLDGAGVEALMPLRDFPVAASRAFKKRPEWAERGELLTFKWQDGTPRFGGTLAAAFGCCRGAPLATALGRVVGAVDEALTAAKRREGVLVFDDLISGARAMLAAHPATAARLMADVRAVLVDEFQDTDATQIDLVRRLTAGGAELFVVGDEKQSIYRFRGAEVEMFAEMRQVIGRELPLADNFRSRPALLAFVNGLAARLFAPVGDAPAWRIRWSTDQRLRARREARTGDVRPSIRMISLVNQIGEGHTALSAIQARALEARVIAATITELLGEGWRPGDLAVLLPALTQVKAYEFALRRFAIPYQLVRGRGFYQCQEVRDLVHLLAAVIDPHEAIVLAGALRSPLFGVSDTALERLADLPGGLAAYFRRTGPCTEIDAPDAVAVAEARALLATLRAARDRVPPAELLTYAIAATGLESVLLAQFHGAQKVANVRKLVAQARTLGRRGFVDADAFVARTRRLLDEEAREPEAVRLATDIDAVQVMTVHQAKGLEFPIVILPDLGREAPRDFRSPVNVDARYGLLAAATFGAGRHRLPHRLIEAWRQDDRDRGEAERARLLYVACTRAREVLILCEGKGRRAALAADEAEPSRSACEQIWSFLGCGAVAAFVAGPDERTVIEAEGEGADGAVIPVAVEIEKSAALLARVPPPPGDVVESTLARVLETTPSAEDVAIAARVLDAPPPPAPPLIMSPTALAAYVRCPRQFWYRHVRGVPEYGGALPPLEPRSSGTAGEAREGVARGGTVASSTAGRAARFGLAAHAALEVLPFDLPAEARPAAVDAALAETQALATAERAAIGRDLLAALARAAAESASFRVHGREVPFCIAVASAPALFVRGRIDLVGERAGRLVVRDYKYARPAPGDEDAYRVQLETYALAVALAHPDRAIEVEIEWLRAPGERVVVPIDLDAVRTRLTAAGNALGAAVARRSADEFPMAFAVPTPCRTIGCAFVARCFPDRHRAFRDQATSGTMAV